MISRYLDQVQKQYHTENATEHSYRGALQELITSIIDNEEVTVVNEPKWVACGAPDFIISKKVSGHDNASIPLGFIEAKDIGKDLKNKAYKEQFDRYKKGLENLIITDYLTFEFHKKQDKTKAQPYETCTIAEVVDGKIVPLENEFTTFSNLITDFVSFVGQTIKSPAKLAAMMAGKAKMLAEVIRKAIESDEENLANSSLKEQMEAFKKILIHDISPSAFADVYAQTITYGMFAARLHDDTLSEFSRREAATLIPQTNPFLRKLFQYVSGYEVDDRIVWIVDSLAAVFVYTDIKELLKNFGKATKTHDPIIHFYETFLAEYDPKLRKARGVWYTPEPVVNFIVRAVDDILKSEFALSDGLSDTSKANIKVPVQGKKTLRSKEVHKVQILDPATGTGTFLAEVIRHVHQQFSGMEGMWSGYVERELIPRLNGFELLMASYAMAHLKLELLLKETGYEPLKPDRFHVYLTNSLEEAHPDTGTLFASWLSNEATAANLVKMETPVMVVLGNPPYSGISINKGKWISDLIDDYKYVDGVHFNERKHWLNDDYVKFIRYGQHFIDRNGEGVLAFINNHSFLDNPTFRGMRWHLLKSFDVIYVIDLHGNALKKEVCPDGSPDQNVFDIQTGVSINLFVKTGTKKKRKLAKVMHADFWGDRQSKYDSLLENKISSIDFKEVEYTEPYYFFVPKNDAGRELYEKGFSVHDIFTEKKTGILTMGDGFIVAKTKKALEERIRDFLENEYSEDKLKSKYGLGKNYAKWIIGNKKNIELKQLKFIEFDYRPFDKRWTVFDNRLVWRWRYETMRHMLDGANVGLMSCRQTAIDSWAHVGVTNFAADDSRVSNRSRERGYIYPLYLYPETSSAQNLSESEMRRHNLNVETVAKIAAGLGMNFVDEKTNTSGDLAPIDILDYVYAVLHSPCYREKYKSFLKIDFPRIPFPKDPQKFRKLVDLGSEIRNLHLMADTNSSSGVATYPKPGSNVIARHIGKNDWELSDEQNSIGKIWINDEQYFDKIPLLAWEFYIGGYQPAQKWLKDHRGRTLKMEEIRHYLNIIFALVETDRVMKEIDESGVV